MRELVREYINRVRPDLNPRAGSPLETIFLDAAAALLPTLDSKISQRYSLSTEDKANLFLLVKDVGAQSEITVRLYFTAACELIYGIGQMGFTAGSGKSMSNKYPVNITSAQMNIYTDDTYYYADIDLTGGSIFISTDSLSWDNPADDFSYLSVSTITSGGHIAETDTTLEDRLANEISLRNIVTHPGAEAWLYDQYQTLIRDAYSVGMGDDEMLRDMIGEAHFGGYIDLYVKEDLPVERTFVFDVVPLDKTIEQSVTLLFESLTESLIYKNILPAVEASITATSTVRTGRTFAEGGMVGYFNVDRENGTITTLSPSQTINSMIADQTPWQPGVDPGYNHWNFDTHDPRAIFNGEDYTGVEYLPVNSFVRVVCTTSTPPIDEFFIIVSAGFVSTVPNFGTRIVLDRDVPLTVDKNDLHLYRFEPVQFDFSYHPMGVDLTSLERPLMWINEINEVDPLTDEPYVPAEPILLMGGYGSGFYGLGPYGLGSTTGYKLIVDDINYRYSCDEEGCIEFIGDYLGSRVQLNYLTSPNLQTIQDAVDSNRAMGSNVLVKAFTPIGLTISVDVDAEVGVTEITGMEEYIWTLANTIELTDIISELYDRGATFVDLDDLISNSTFVKWKTDGSYETLTASSAGVINADDATARFLPLSITVTVS
jgi:hypothetical protein